MQLIRITLYCDPVADADLLTIIRQWPLGSRSRRLKDWLRHQALPDSAGEQRLSALENRMTALESGAVNRAPLPTSDEPGWGSDAMNDLLNDMKEGDGHSC